jgi:hypothetical protein
MLVAFAVWSDQFAHYLEGLLGVDADYVLAVLRIIGINIVLSGDNAVVIALACRTLPRDSGSSASSSAPALRWCCASSSRWWCSSSICPGSSLSAD